jgi:exonuclease III
MSIIQWNINSYNENRPELERLLSLNPALVCLQETRADAPLKVKGYISYNVYSRTTDDRACLPIYSV